MSAAGLRTYFKVPIRRLIVVGLAALIPVGLIAEPAGAVPVTHELIASFGGGATPAGAMGPHGIAVDQQTGNVYVADTENDTVDAFNPLGEYQPSLLLTLEFEALQGVAIDQATGDRYVCNGSEVDAFSSSGELLLRIPQKFGAFGVAVNENTGDVYVALPFGGIVGVFNSSGEPQPSLQLSGTPSGSLGLVVNVAVEQRTGDVYVADLGNHVVDKFGPSSEYISTIDGSQAPSKSIEPWGLAVDQSNGELYVGDVGAGVVDEFSAAGGYQEQIQAPAGSMNPKGVAVDANRNVYIADAANGVVDIFNSKVAPVLASVSVGPVSELQVEGAVLNGSVNPNGLAVSSCRFEYGITETYGQSMPCVPDPGAGEEAVAVSATLVHIKPNTLYYYRLVATDVDGDEPTSAATFQTPRLPPTVDDKPAFAAGVGPLEATLSGTIDPNGIPVAYHFVYGTSTAYGSVIPVPEAYMPLNEGDDQVAPQTVTGLQPGTTYHFALVATSADGVLVGREETFTTSPILAPVVSTGGAGEVTLGAASVSGSIDPQGVETVYHFEYGPTVAYGASWPTVDVALGALTVGQPVTSDIQNLLPGTLYHYRLVATNSGGTVYGADQTFTTPSYPVSVVQVAPQLPGVFGVNPESTGSKARPHKHKAKVRHERKGKKRRAKKGSVRS